MKAELVKRQDRWDLYGEDGSKIASSSPNPMGKLSVKNCETIANGYDLDELAESEYGTVIESVRGSKEYDIEADRKSGFKTGFKKALEILGDKKFSINEVVELCKILMSNPFETSGKTYQELTDNYIQSLQQTEWDVEVIMKSENMRYDGGKQIEYDIVPKLDADSCLILKRI